MALGDPYATLPQLKSFIGLGSGVMPEDADLTASIASVSAEIQRYCGRQFNKADAATPRRYRALRGGGVAYVDDFWELTDVAVDHDGDGVYETVLTVADYELEPLDGIVDGVPGWPWWRIVVVNRRFPWGRRPGVQVTAKWGWSEVPAPVHEACLILAAETGKLGEAPFGVAGFDQFGAVRVRQNPLAKAKLDPYVLDSVLVA